MSTASLTPLEKEVLMVETAITLPEKSAPIRMPTKYSAEPTLVYGPNPNATELEAYPSGISGTSVIFPNEMVHVVTNHPFLTEVYHVPVVSKRASYLWRFRNIGLNTETLSRAGTGSVVGPASAADKVDFVDARPSDSSQGSPVDQLVLNGTKQVAFQALGRRGIYLDQFMVFAMKCVSASASGIVNVNWYRWQGDNWQVIIPEAYSVTMTTGDIKFWQPLDAGIYSLDITSQMLTTWAFWTSNDNPAAPLTVGRMTWGANPAGLFNGAMAFKIYNGLGTQWGAFEKIRVNCISQRFTPVSNDYAQGGTIDQAQVPSGDDINDVLDALMNVYKDATSYIQSLPGRRFEPNKKGSNCPMTPDGPKYWDYRTCVRVDAYGVCWDNWISLDEPMTCVIVACQTVVPPAGVAAPQFVATVNAHVEAFSSGKLLERGRALVSAEAVDKAIAHLSGMYLVTENPDHVSGILGQLWDSIRGGVGTIGKAIIGAGATMGPLAPVAFGIGGAMTGASMLSSGAIKNALGMKAETGARLAPAAVERVNAAVRAIPQARAPRPRPQPRVVVEEAPVRRQPPPPQPRRRPTVVEVVEPQFRQPVSRPRKTFTQQRQLVVRR